MTLGPAQEVFRGFFRFRLDACQRVLGMPLEAGQQHRSENLRKNLNAQFQDARRSGARRKLKRTISRAPAARFPSERLPVVLRDGQGSGDRDEKISVHGSLTDVGQRSLLQDRVG